MSFENNHTTCTSTHDSWHLKHYLVYTELEPVLGQTSISITVELEVVASSSSTSLLFFSASASFCCSSFPAASWASVGAGGDPEPGEVGEAGDAGETGEGGDVGDVGEGGERGEDGGVCCVCTSALRSSWLSGSCEAAGSSEFFSVLLVGSSSWLEGFLRSSL